MAGKTKRAALQLTKDHETMLRRLAGSRTAPVLMSVLVSLLATVVARLLRRRSNKESSS